VRPLHWTAALLLALAAAVPALPDDRKPDAGEEGFVPLFNGKDLTSWVNVNCAPRTFFVKDNEIITTGKPTGYLRTARQYENFVAEFDWMHVNKKEVGNSGFFVWADPIPAVGTPYTRGIEVQVLVNLEKEGHYTSHGDLFSIWSATCKPDRPHPQGWARCLPSERRCKGGGEWNHYKVIGNDGTLKLHVNGKEVSGLSECKPRKGYLALESEGAECHFRNLKIKELPSTNPKRDEVADEAKGFVNLYTGLDLSGWTATDEAKKHWQPRDYVLHYDGKSEAKDNALRTEKEYGGAEFIVDFRFPAKKDGEPAPCWFVLREDKDGTVRFFIAPDGRAGADSQITRPGAREAGGKFTPFKELKPAGQWNRLHATLTGKSLKVTVNGANALEGDVTLDPPPPSKGWFALRPGGEMDFANLFVRPLK
jgi:hypothetical protein